jgi:hypothetical protein
MGPWQQREAYLALERQGREARFPVIPVLLPGAEPALGFLGQQTWVDLRTAPGDSVLLEILAGAIRGEPPGPDAQERVARTLATVCPYRGLLYFREEDAPFFCGRKAAIHGLLQAVSVRREPLVAVVGASGCGKSSVVRAGLVPALRRDLARVWDVVTIVPGARPLHALAAGLLPLLEPTMTEADRLIEVNKVAGALESGAVHLPEIVARIVQKQMGTDRLMLVADQWEELYTLTADGGLRRRVIDELLEATTASPLTVVLTLRGDFVGHALAYRPLADRLQGAQVNLGPMVREELRQAIEQPAKKVELHFEPGLVDRILQDAGDEPGNLPLLEFVLRQLWDRRHHGELQHAAYEDLGRLSGAVAQKADEVSAGSRRSSSRRCSGCFCASRRRPRRVTTRAAGRTAGSCANTRTRSTRGATTTRRTRPTQAAREEPTGGGGLRRLGPSRHTAGSTTWRGTCGSGRRRSTKSTLTTPVTGERILLPQRPGWFVAGRGSASRGTCGCRLGLSPGFRYLIFGFRCARDVSP